MKILLTGGSGKLGQELQKHRDYLAPSRAELDLTKEQQIKDYLELHQPDLIVLSGGYVKSLEPESDTMEALECFWTNVLSVQYFVKYAMCPIIYISTEGVIDPYNIYTATKLMAENIIKKHHSYTIIRTNFWPRPFQFPKAADDLITIGDYIDKIAFIINCIVGMVPTNQIIYAGTGAKTVANLARETRPDIEGVPAETFGIPKRRELFYASMCSIANA